MSDVFVSYKAEDRRRVRPLVDALEADGYSVWWDEQIGGGTAWRHEIEAKLNAAKCVVVIWSKRSVGPEGEFVQDEAARAKERHVYVPVTIDNVHLPLGFGETQALPLTGWRGNRSEARYRAVLAAVQRNVGGNGASAVHPLVHSGMDRRTAIAGSAAAVAAVAGLGAWALLRRTFSGASSESIAVLPFANLSGDANQAYFSDGIAEEIRNALTRLSRLKVVGRISSEAVRNDDAETAAKKLGVANILSGSVRQSPSTIRISAQLIDGRNGFERWSETYDRAPGDAIKIQTDIAENVASALSQNLRGAAHSAIAVGGTQNPQAQRLFLQANEASGRGTKDGFQRGLSLLDGAIALDPKYGEAYAARAFVLEFYADIYASGVDELFAYRAKALQSAKVALSIAPNLPATHRALAQIYQGLLDARRADAEYRKALELAPSDAATNRDYANLLERLGQSKRALALADKAIALDPLDGNAYGSRYSALYSARRYADAIAFTKQVQRKSPNLFNWPAEVGWSLLWLGNFDEAQKYFSLAPADSYRRLVGESALLIRGGRRAEVPAKIATLRGVYGDPASYQFAQIYAQLGDKDQAFAALDRAWTIRDTGLFSLKSDPFLDPLRSDPRYAALLRKMNFPAG